MMLLDGPSVRGQIVLTYCWWGRRRREIKRERKTETERERERERQRERDRETEREGICTDLRVRTS